MNTPTSLYTNSRDGSEIRIALDDLVGDRLGMGLADPGLAIEGAGAREPGDLVKHLRCLVLVVLPVQRGYLIFQKVGFVPSSRGAASFGGLFVGIHGSFVSCGGLGSSRRRLRPR